MRFLGALVLVGCGSTSDPAGFAPSVTAASGGASGGTAGTVATGCVVDMDCKGARICTAGSCVDPGAGGTTFGGSTGSGGHTAISPEPADAGDDARTVDATPEDAGTCRTWTCEGTMSILTIRACVPPELPGAETGRGCSTDAGSYRCGEEAAACTENTALPPQNSDPCTIPVARVHAADDCFPRDCACWRPTAQLEPACMPADSPFCSAWLSEIGACLTPRPGGQPTIGVASLVIDGYRRHCDGAWQP